MADGYSQGHICTEDLMYSSTRKNYNAYSIESANNKHLCAIKWHINGHYYWLTVISPSSSYSYNSGDVTTNINDYINNNRCNSSIRKKYSDTWDAPHYPPFPITDPPDIALNIENIYDVTNVSGAKWLIECTIPIYTITSNSDFEKVNRYKDTGDDSEADNYDDLHPSTLTITVKYDGQNYPNFYVKGVVEGVAEVNEFTIHTSSSSDGDIAEVNVVPNGSWNTFSYGELCATSNATIDFFIYCDALSSGGSIGHADASVYFSWKNNTGISNIITPSTNGKVILVVEEGVPTYDDDGGDNNPWTDTNNSNTFSGSNKLTETYKLTDAKLVSLGNFFWSSTFKDNIMALCNYPLENVIALKAMPIVLTGTEKEIKIGNVSSGITADKVSSADNYEVTVGSVFIPEYFQNFIDYSGVNLQIYLPFIGYKELDNLVCMNRWLRVRYVFDVIMGTCMACLDVKDINSTYMQYQCYQGNCGIDIAITSTNRASIENGYINAGLDTVSDILRGDIGGAVKDVFSASTQDFHSQSNGAGNPSLMNRLTNVCYVIVRRPKKYDLPANYGHTYGFPYFKKKTLSTLTGFTVCENFDCAIAGATDIERSEIKQLLENGVYIKEVL